MTQTSILLKKQVFLSDAGERFPRRPKINDPPWRDDFARDDMLTPFFSVLLDY